MILLIDNYDSFTYNLYQYIGEFYPRIEVVRNDEITVEEAINSGAERIILSPGPGRPEEAGICVNLIRELKGRIPLLGICLGHQAIGYAYGGRIVRADKILHGKTSMVIHNGHGVFYGIKNPICATRYHSLVIDKESLPQELEITAYTSDGTIMGIRHKSLPVYGLQFHPESILTENGKQILKNFLGGILNVA
ncbi:anthranilate synthase, component II [Caldanaerobius fijiensis DSM 17918]|uniref:Anthranilate synthase, component II n=1 Tax=Caldanaerobius fijiensis DSM 17918 TaxID=1121256 RepID=A0A1M4TB02_9THEO|nr:aminodeoxychorismate/anthranilate synthase component II [Caldanaerobius fijiensis]SHE41605.1 anthranilate synthase, component II [Caldanaerobius fijiensis DSM 17918]